MFPDTAIFPKRLQYFLLIFHYVLEFISLVSDSWGWVFGNLGQRELMDDITVVYKHELTSHLCLRWADCDRHTGKAAKTPRSLYLCNEVYPSLLMLSKERRAGAMDVGTYRCIRRVLYIHKSCPESVSDTTTHTTSLTPWQSLNPPTSACHTIPTLLPPGFECSTRVLRGDSSCSGCTCVSSGCFSLLYVAPCSSLCVCDAIPICIYSLPERWSELSFVVKSN